jgi:hypothetical protein
MKLNYSEGTWFAVPLLNGGFGVGVVARTTSKGRVILVYLFGPKRETVPTLSEVIDLDPLAAIKVARIGDLNLINGEWPILGRSPSWQRSSWPIPQFVRSDELSHRAWIVYYADDDPNRCIREEPVAYGTSAFGRNSVIGAGGVEIVLTDLLSS